MTPRLTILVLLQIFIVFNLMGMNHGHASTYAQVLTNIEFDQDESSIRRGALIYHKTCRVCHEMKYVHYKNFMDIGFAKSKVDEIRADQQMNASLSKTITDDVLTEFYGQVPPDLSVMAKARKHGPQYIYTLLTSYTYSEKEGLYNNTLMDGIKMPDIMNVSTAVDATHKNIIIQDIKDVTEFLTWASDPHAATRKTMGMFVVIYFIILSILLYFVMKRTWSKLDL